MTAEPRTVLLQDDSDDKRDSAIVLNADRVHVHVCDSQTIGLSIF